MHKTIPSSISHDLCGPKAQKFLRIKHQELTKVRSVKLNKIGSFDYCVGYHREQTH